MYQTGHNKNNKMAEGVRDGVNINSYNLDVCELCGRKDNLKICARCRCVSYCCRDHQVQHWPTHKVICKKLFATGATINPQPAKTYDTGIGLYGVNRGVKVSPVIEGVDKLSIYNCSGNCTSASDLRVKGEQKFAHRESYNMDQCSCFDESVEASGVHDQYGVAFGGGSDILEELSNLDAISHTSSNYTSSPSDIHQTPPGEILSGSSENYILETEDSSLLYSGVPPSTNMPTSSNKETYYTVVQSRIKALCQYVVKCLTAYGVCVIDNFLGEAKGTEIFGEVLDLQQAGILSSGQLVNASSPNVAIRGDLITWIDGNEFGCVNINVLISSIDAIMIQCQRRLGKLISGRTKVRFFCKLHMSS